MKISKLAVTQKKMPGHYIPKKEVFEMIMGLPQGFWLEVNRHNEVFIHLKFPASILASIQNGCELKVVLRNPLLKKNSVTLYVFDNQNHPLFIEGSNFDFKDNKIYDDEVIIEFVRATNLNIMLYNISGAPIMKYEITKKDQYIQFQEWVKNVQSNKEYQFRKTEVYFENETEEIGFALKLNNIDVSKNEKMNTCTYEDMKYWHDYNMYNFDNFIENGKHGYNQEFSIRDYLNRYFTTNSDFFYSPKNIDGNELIDFLIIIQNVTVLIESKYVRSAKMNKFTQAIKKATSQLLEAEKRVLVHKIFPDNILNEKIKRCNVIIRICLINDEQLVSLLANKEYVKTHIKAIQPIFMTDVSLNSLLGLLKEQNEEYYKINFAMNLLNLYSKFQKSNDEILYLNIFKDGGKKDF